MQRQSNQTNIQSSTSFDPASLFIAVKNGHLDFVKTLLAYGSKYQ